MATNAFGSLTLRLIRLRFPCHIQEIIQADAHVKTAADLVTKYRKNVQYNLDATRTAATQPE